MDAACITKFHSSYIPEPNSGCWIWEARMSNTRYGSMYWKGVDKKAHRFSWELFNGPIPEGMSICHNCDNTLCVNPNHLFLGSHQENMDDKVRKGRASKLSRSSHPMTKITLTMAKEIQVKYTGKLGEIKKLAKEYNVGRDTISRALKM